MCESYVAIFFISVKNLKRKMIRNIPLNELCDTFSVILSSDKSKNFHRCHCQQGSRWSPQGTFLSNVRILVSDYGLGMVWHMVAEASKHIEVS